MKIIECFSAIITPEYAFSIYYGMQIGMEKHGLEVLRDGAFNPTTSESIWISEDRVRHGLNPEK